MHAGRATRKCRGLTRVMLGVVVGEVEVGVGAGERDDLQIRVVLDQIDEFRQF